MLLEFGVDPNLCDGMGQTALHRACCRGWVEVVGELRGKGAKMGVRDREGNTGLHLAVEEGHVSFFSVMVVGIWALMLQNRRKQFIDH